MRAGQRALERGGLCRGRYPARDGVNREWPTAGIRRARSDRTANSSVACQRLFRLFGLGSYGDPTHPRACPDLARSLGAAEQLASILYYVWLHHAMRCEYEMADAAISELYSSAESSGNAKSLILAQMADLLDVLLEGRLSWQLPSEREARGKHTKREPTTIWMVAQITNQRSEMFHANMGCGFLWHIGGIPTRLFASHRINSRGRVSWAHFQSYLELIGGGITLALRGDAKRTREWHAEARALGREHALAHVEQYVDPVWEGVALIWVGEYEEGHARFSSGAQAWEAAGGVHNFVQVRTSFARACLGKGQVEQAQSWARAAIELADETGHRWYEAEAHRVLGDVLLALSDAGAAETAFRKAIEVAKGTESQILGSCAPPPASPACGVIRASAPRPMTCLPRSTAGSPRASTHWFCKTPRHCSTR